MADRPNIICEPLCFLFNKYGKESDNELKTIFYNFYLSVDIGIAKELLSSELEKIKPTGWSKPARRRDGSIDKQELRVKKEVNDIFQMLAIIHDQKLVELLPVFTCADLKRIPSSSFDTGDFRAMIQKFERLENILESSKTARVDLTGLENVIKESVKSSIKDLTKEKAPDYSSLSTNPGQCPESQVISDKYRDLRISALSQDSIGNSDSESGMDNGSWETQVSRRYKRLRSSVDPSISHRNPSTAAMDANGKTLNFLSALTRPSPNRFQSDVRGTGNIVPATNPSRNRLKLYGKSSEQLGIKCARVLTKKKYFYVGNLEESCSVEELSKHLSSIGISTLKCNPARSGFKNSASFHVCIEQQFTNQFTNVEQLASSCCHPRVGFQG